MNNLFNDSGVTYNPESGLIISSNLFIFIIIIIAVSTFYGLIAKSFKIRTEFSDMFVIGLINIFLIYFTTNIKYINGDPVIVCLLFGILAIVLRPVITYLGWTLESVILVSNTSLLVFSIVRNHLIINDLYNKLSFFKTLVDTIRN